MKQKRKVKSLIPHKADFSGNFLTILLLVLSFMLCLGSASLMTTSVGAAEDEDMTKMIYSGMNDNFEVLYRLSLVDPESLTDIAIQEAYVVDDSLYLTPNKVIVTSSDSEAFVNNVDGENIYVNILGGEGNTVKSDNITIIAGNQNQILSNKHNNASLLGGEYNKIDGDSNVNSAPAVVAGGKSNEVKHNNGSVVVGGIKNSIEMGKENVILGGSGNRIYMGENVIVGGENVKVDDIIKNIFAFSNEDSSFEPESESAFYLNLTNGVGIHVDAVKTGVSVGGAVGFGKVDITNNTEKCKNDIIGMEGTWYVDGNHGCLVGCTKESSNSSRWELLDRGSFCEEKCNQKSSYCVVTGMNIDLQGKSDYVGFCIIDNIDITNASRCTTGEEKNYNNVVFEGVLIDSDDLCPMLGDNKCVYKCEPGYKLDGNKCVLDGTVISKQCTGPEITDKNATLVAGSEGLQKDEKRTLYDRGHAAGKNCAYECNDGYHVEGNACVDDWKVEPCTHGEKPDNAHYIDTGVVVRWVNGSWTSPDACLWDCDGEYKKDGDKCVLDQYECKGHIPNNATLLEGTNTGLVKDVDIIVYNTVSEASPDDKCVYICNESYYVYKGDCLKCPSGKFNENGLCISDICPEDNPFFDGVHCVPYALCKRNSSFITVKALDNFKNIKEKGKYITPLTDKSEELKCVDADDPEWGKVESNTCTYSCDSDNGYYCNRALISQSSKNTDSWCQQPSCDWTQANEGNVDSEVYYESGGEPGNHNFGTVYSVEEILKLYNENGLTENEIETIKQNYNKYSNINDKNQFHDLFGNWSEKCVYWCPEDNRYYYEGTNKPYIYSCMKDKETADAKNDEYEKVCATITSWFGVPSQYRNAGVPNTPGQSWIYYDNLNDYNSAKTEGKSCIWACPSGSQPLKRFYGDGCTRAVGCSVSIIQQNKLYDQYGVFKPNLLTYSKYYDYNTCYKDCGTNQYLYVYGSTIECRDCVGGRLTGYQTNTIDGTKYGGYRMCELDCGEREKFDPLTNSCVCRSGLSRKNGVCECKIQGQEWDGSKCECPEGLTLSDVLGKCIQGDVLPCDGKPEDLKYCKITGQYLSCDPCVDKNEEWNEEKCDCD